MQKDEIVEKTAGIIRKYLGQDYGIVLFGSWARGDALETSDIDIGILGKKEVPWKTMVNILEEVRKIPTLRKIDVVDLYVKEGHFRKNVLRYAKSL